MIEGAIGLVVGALAGAGVMRWKGDRTLMQALRSLGPIWRPRQ